MSAFAWQHDRPGRNSRHSRAEREKERGKTTGGPGLKDPLIPSSDSMDDLAQDDPLDYDSEANV